ncbi:MAG: cache domain-containing protein, partial [Planctomycetota bacterium]
MTEPKAGGALSSTETQDWSPFGQKQPLWLVVVVRTVLPAVLAVAVAGVVVFYLALPRLREHLMRSRRESARSLVQVAVELLKQYHERVLDGELGVEEARRRAKRRIAAMRYGPNRQDYLWVNDFDRVVLVHPVQPQLVGRDLSDRIDPETGQYIIRTFVRVGRQPGGGFVAYHWPTIRDPQVVEPKISYVAAFEPWGWVVGTGIYVQDVQHQMASITRTLTLSFLGVLGLMVLLSGYMIVRSERSERRLRQSESVFRAHFQRGLIGMAVASPEGDWLEVNQRLAEIVGRPPATLRGSNWIELTHPEDRDAVTSRYRTLVDGEVDEYSMESRLMRADGSVAEVELYVVSMRDSGRSLHCAGVHVLDVTRRKQAERERARHLQFLNDLDRIDRVLHQATDLDEALEACLDEVRDILACDRAWLLYPCEPDSDSLRMMMQSAPTAHYARGLMDRPIRLTPEGADLVERSLAEPDPVVLDCTRQTDVLVEKNDETVHAQIQLVVRPRTGKAWLFGIQQIERERCFTPGEKNLLREVGRRLGDSLTVMLILQEARRSEENLAITLDSIGDGVIATDDQGRVRRINAVAEKLTGWMSVEAIGRELTEVFQVVDATSGDPLHSPYDRILRQRGPIKLSGEMVLIDRTGKRRRIADSGAPIRDRGGRIVGVVLVFRDVTSELQAQAQLQHPSKMQAVGQLAGGVAHDFNNLLAGIMGNAELLGRRLAPGPDEQKMIDAIMTASQRGAQLTRQLLSFSRKETFQRTDVDMHLVVNEVAGLLKHSIDKRIDLQLNLQARQTTIRGD